MVLMLLGTMGCQQDLVRVMGAVTGVSVSPRAPGDVARAEGPERSPVAEVSEPVAAPAPQDVAVTAATVTDDSAPPAGGFNPISMPQGPRDTPGVRWDGVRGHTQEAIAEERATRGLDR